MTTRSMRSSRSALGAVHVGLALGTLALVPATMISCTSTGIALRESMGIAKREQLVDRVKEARDAQDAARVQFKDALDEFLAVTNQSGKASELESRYRSLQKEYERSESRAGAVSSRIASVEAVADRLFAEWGRELDQYTDARLRSSSERQLNDSKARYAQLIGAMKSAEGKMKPVLDSLRNQVLFLKHNLNAQAIAGLQGTAVEVQNDVSALIRDMETAIAEADRFISQMSAN
jgi:hypothetical protein